MNNKTTTEKKKVKYCACGFPQSYPIPHEHSRTTTTETQEAIKYQAGDATRAQMLKEAGIDLEQYKKACLSVEEFIALLAKEKQDLLMSLLDKYNEVDEECEKAGYGTGFVNYVGILESWIEDFEKLAELKGEK